VKLQRPKARGGSQAAYTSNRLVHNPLFHHLSNKINLSQSQLLNRKSHLPTKIAADMYCQYPTISIPCPSTKHEEIPYHTPSKPSVLPSTVSSHPFPPPSTIFRPLPQPLPSLPTSPHPPPQPPPPSKLKNHHSSTYLHPCIIPMTQPARCLSHTHTKEPPRLRNEQCIFELPPLLFQTCSGFFRGFFGIPQYWIIYSIKGFSG